MSTKRWTLVISLMGLIGWGFTYLYEEWTGDFRLNNITYEVPKQLLLEPTLPDAGKLATLKTLFKQPFTFLGKGHQTFVFASEDGKYVLKFFRFKRLKPSVVMHYLAYVPGLQNFWAKQEKLRQRRLEKLFQGYGVVQRCDQSTTGIVFVHLNKTDYFQQHVRVIDRLGFTHEIDLDTTFFAVQERARMTKELLIELLEQGDIRTAKQRIRQLFDLYAIQYSQGIIDQDQNVMDNTGFVGERAIRLDMGQLKLAQNNQLREDLRKIATKRINGWLQKRYPHFQAEIAHDMEAKLSQLFGEPFTLTPTL